MNNAVLNDLIRYYKEHFDEIKDREIYKWEAIEHFQKHWDIDALDFAGMLKEAFSKNSPIKQSNYYAIDTIIKLAEERPRHVQMMFKDLFDQTKDLVERLRTFKMETKHTLKSVDSLKLNDSHQDHLAMMGYLTFRYPKTHYFYKFSVFKDFAEFINYPYIPKKGAFVNIPAFEKLCDIILLKVKNDHELLKLNKERHNQYFIDKNYHLLVQDILYSLVYYKNKAKFPGNYKTLHPEMVKNASVEIKELEATPYQPQMSLEFGSKPDYRENQKQQKEIGNAGETFVMTYEKERVKKIDEKLEEKVEWTSNIKGDGLGYDIQSFDDDGNTIYIEVKTTKGNELTPFYITRNELEMSNRDPSNYYLYRVYDFDASSSSGKIARFKGSLESLCVNPTLYKVVFKS